ncbi:GNAT family N-acetyltransferase [Micromonospora sp. NPDC049559]|uniref:GNAT family N-acetyltransferase n=1 Tax=Micromonospora sp. NPDC049559 TaxID=3155923 RepID=UPI0034248723
MPSLVPPVLPGGALSGREQPTLYADGALTLRPFRPADAPAVALAFTDPAIQRWHTHAMASADEAVAWINQWRVHWAAERAASWAVTDADDALVGRVGLREINLFDGVAEVAYWVLPEARGRGVVVRATEALARWSFEELGLHRLTLRHSTLNQPSCRAAEKAGFALEGVERSALLHTDGWHDMHLHARLTDLA